MLFTSDKSEDKLKYKGMSPWNPPVDWTLITNDQFYGKQIRSAYYIKGGTGNCKAVWNLPLKEKGFYKLSAYIGKMRMMGGRGGRDEKTTDEYHYSISSDDGLDHQTIDLKNADGGWV